MNAIFFVLATRAEEEFSGGLDPVVELAREKSQVPVQVWQQLGE